MSSYISPINSGFDPSKIFGSLATSTSGGSTFTANSTPSIYGQAPGGLSSLGGIPFGGQISGAINAIQNPSTSKGLFQGFSSPVSAVTSTPSSASSVSSQSITPSVKSDTGIVSPYVTQNQPTIASSYAGGDTTLPAYGTPEYAQAQQLVQNTHSGLQNPVSGMNGNFSNSSTGNPYTGYNVNVPNQTNSNVIGSGLGYADVLGARQNLMNDYQAAGNKYASDYQNITGQSLKGQFAGDTQDYGTGMANLIKLEGTPVLQADQMRQANALGALGANNQTLGALSPQSVAPGSSLVSPTGQQVYQGGGAAPSTIVSTAQSLAQQAMQYGTPKLDANGQLDMGYYTQQAQQLYGGLNGQGGQSSIPQSSTGISLPPITGAAGTPNYTPQGQGSIASLPQQLQQYATPSTVNGIGVGFINAANVPPSLQPAAQVAARQAGIPYLTDNDAQGVYAVQNISQALDQAQALAIDTLKSGTSGHIEDSLVNWANGYLQFNPELQNFGVLKDTAAKSVTALAGGVGSGLRLNTATINTAVNNMPTADDNLESALTKIQALRTLLNNQMSTRFPQFTGQGNLLNTGSQSTSGTGTGGQYDW